MFFERLENLLLSIFGCKVNMIFFNSQIYFSIKILKINQLRANFRIENFRPQYFADVLNT